MPNYTTHYNLKKPLKTEGYKVDDANGNMDIIEAGMSAHDTAIAAVQGDTATATYDDTKTTTAEVTRLNCLNKNLVSLVITGKTIVNLTGAAGDCEDVSLWSFSDSGNTVLDSSNKVFGSNSFKITIPTGKITTYDIKDYFNVIDKTKYYGISAYLKNGNATNIQLSFNGNVGQILSTITDATKFNRQFVKVQPSNISNVFQIASVVNGAAGQYANVDAIQIEEITAEQYADPNWKPSPYVTSDTSVGDTAGRVKSVGKNLISLAQGSVTAIGTLDTTTNKRISHKNGVVPVNPNTTYSVSLTSPLFYAYNEWDVNKNVVNAVGWSSATATSLAITTGANTRFLQVTFKIDDTTPIYPQNYQIQLEEGATATAYEPYTETVVPIPYPLKSLPNGVADIQDTRKGKVFKNVEKLLLDGSLSWTYVMGVTGYKAISIPTPVNYVLRNAIAYKYNNKVIKPSPNNDIGSGADYYSDNATNFYLAVPAADSGWGDSYVPNAAEIQAERFGWKMYDNVSVANAYSSGTKAWCRKGTLDMTTNTCPTTLAPGFTPDRLYYQLAQPQEIDIPVADLVALPGGSLVVENDAQSWVRPKIDYTVNKNSRANLESLMQEFNNAIKAVAPKKQEDWIKPTLLNGWVRYDVAYASPSYFKDSLGIVHLKGLAKSGTGAIFMLPIGYRPATLLILPAMSNEALGRCNIGADGSVTMFLGSNVYFCLDGISFKAEQ